MKKLIMLLIISAIIFGTWLSGCSSDKIQDEIIEAMQNDDKSTYATQDGDEITDQQDGDEITDDPQVGDDPEELKGEITYPKFGKYGFQNILADDFVEAIPTGDKLVEYSVNAEVTAGAGLKIVIITKNEDLRMEWGGFYSHTVENWYVTNYENDTRSNTFTVYESGKPANVTVLFTSDCIVEYYENGATTPTKVKEIKMNPGGMIESPDPGDVTYSGVITYPKFGKYGFPNILADDFFEAVPTGDKLVEYSVNAEAPAGAGLKIIIKSVSSVQYMEWGGFYPHSVENWYVTNYDSESRSNTMKLYESGKTANVTVTLFNDCIIEYYENGATTPTKTKQIKMNPNGIVEKPEPPGDVTYSGVITYPKLGKYGFPNILADDFVEAVPTGDKLVEYSVNADVPAGAALKIILISKNPTPYMEWGGFYPASVENWYVTNYDNDSRSNTMTVYESGKPANVTVTFFNDCILQYYENGATTPTKVKTIRMKR